MTEKTSNRVVFRKQLSDGNYGSEVAEVLLEVDNFDDTALSDIDKASEEAIAAALARARQLVHAELRKSPSSNVRRALEPPISEERWRRAEEAAEYELAAGKRDNAREDVDDDDDLPL